MEHPDRNRLIAAVRRILSRKADESDKRRLSALSGDLYDQVSEEDLAAYAPRQLADFVTSANDLLTVREPGHSIVRLVNPDPADSAESECGVTLVEMLNDDMPFLVDSTLLELQDFGAEIRLVAHPIIAVTRDGTGRLTGYHGLAPGPADANNESLIQIHIARIIGQAERDALTERLRSLLVEVRRAVTDWRPMRDRLSQMIEIYKRTPPPVPADDVNEAIAFLEWLADNNFTLLGVREYAFSGGAARGRLRRASTRALGILADPKVRVLSRGGHGVTTTPAIREFLMRSEPLIVTKSNLRSRIHRRTYADYVGVKRYREDGKLAGETRFIGLFTSTAYNRSVLAIPYLRRKAASIAARAGFTTEGHSGRALVNVLESYPRDEFFQADEETLFHSVMAIMDLNVRPRVRVLARRDKFDRFVSVLVFVPRDRYDSDARAKIGAYLAEVFDGHVSAYYPTFLEGTLTRVQYIIGRAGGKTPDPGEQKLESDIAQIIELWTDALHQAIHARFDPTRAEILADHYRDAFPAAYRYATSPDTAVDDIATFARLTASHPIAGAFHDAEPDRPDTLTLRLIHLGEPIPLSVRVPMLENMGLRVIDEQTFQVTPSGGHADIHIHEMALERADGNPTALDREAGPLFGCFLAVWYGHASNDGYNALVVNAGLAWRDVAILRSISRYLRQTGTPLTQRYMWETLNRHAAIARTLVELFHARFDPNDTDEVRARRRAAKIEAALEDVASLDEDRIIRRFVNIIDATLRTNFFQTGADGEPHLEISFKLDSQRIEELPEPRPFREIFIYSPRVEGVHLRFGKAARGGIRWSDRPLDFRTEILGLAKAQQAKNAVIVPVGAKGGFVPKRLPADGDRAAFMAEGTAAYRAFISSLLDITDNLDDDETVPPADVVCRDEDDPYLVVAADKGTATFSDTANEIAESRNFWLGDAFASGGSHGYDHKKMGITARGAWEAVKRHFREMDIDIQTTPFTVVGVGDMSGDVFGNGMLLSEQIRLVAAFDHRDIFLDPTPDPAVSHAERRRLFKLPRSSWQDYDKTRISKGGGVFSRKEKSIPLSVEVREALGISADKATPNALIRAILQAPADLLFFGGIGTYVRGAAETPEQIGDRANDAVRVTGDELRVRVIGEGGNLAMTQAGRIDYCLAGGRCNSDAIDNSAGVNTSDVEVNIKIALGRAIRNGRLDMKARDRLLIAMTDEVAALVLRNNYLQTLAISLTEAHGFAYFAYQRRLIQDLERRGILDRVVEGLPDEAAFTERRAASQPLTRPEIAVLLAYAKIALNDDLLVGAVADDPTLDDVLLRYFPARMQADFAEDIEAHRMRPEIIATMIANSMINRGGPTYVIRVSDRTGAPPVDIARAYVTTREAFGLRTLNNALDTLDNRVAGATQIQLYQAIQELTVDKTIWFLRNADMTGALGALAVTYRGAIEGLGQILDSVLPEEEAARLGETIQRHQAAGVPEDIATAAARLPFLGDALDIHLVAEAAGVTFDQAAAMFYTVGERFRIDRAARRAAAIPMADYYDEMVRDRALEAMGLAHRQITVGVIRAGGPEAWREIHAKRIERSLGILSGTLESEELTLSRLTVATNLLTDLATS